MLPVSSKELVRFTPEAEPRYTYLLKVPTVQSRAAFQRDLTAAGAQHPSDEVVRAALREGIHSLFTETERAPLIELLDLLDVEGTELPETDVKQLEEVEMFVRSYHPPYARLIGERVFYHAMWRAIAVQNFVAGIEGEGAVYAAHHGRMTEDALNRFPLEHLTEVAGKIMELMFPSKEQEKNSDSPLQSHSTQETLTAEVSLRTVETDGKSSAPATPPTPSTC